MNRKSIFILIALVAAFLLLALPVSAQAQVFDEGDVIAPISSANIRSCASTTNCGVVVSRFKGRPMVVIDVVEGERVNGSTVWYRVETIQRYVSGHVSWTDPAVYEGYVHSSVVTAFTESATSNRSASVRATATPRPATSDEVCQPSEYHRATAWATAIVPILEDFTLDSVIIRLDMEYIEGLPFPECVRLARSYLLGFYEDTYNALTATNMRDAQRYAESADEFMQDFQDEIARLTIAIIAGE